MPRPAPVMTATLSLNRIRRFFGLDHKCGGAVLSVADGFVSAVTHRDDKGRSCRAVTVRRNHLALRDSQEDLLDARLREGIFDAPDGDHASRLWKRNPGRGVLVPFVLQVRGVERHSDRKAHGGADEIAAAGKRSRVLAVES